MKSLVLLLARARAYLAVLCLGLMMLPAIALAQEIAAPATDAKGALMALFIQHVAPVLFSGIALAMTYAFTQLGKKYGASAAESKRDAALTRLFLFAQSVVADLEATLKPHLLKATADGVLTEVEIATLRAAALDRLKQLAGEKGLAEVQALLGIASPQLDAFLSGLIERAVATLPSSGTKPLQNIIAVSGDASKMGEALDRMGARGGTAVPR